jgi:hypothetical protein
MNFHHHRWGFPCCVCFPVCACCRHYPGRTNGSCSLVLSHPLRPSPRERRVGSCIALFEACSTFILVTACTLTESLFTTLYTEGSSDFVASTAASVVTGWNEPVPGRVYLPLKNTAFHGALPPLRFASVGMTRGRRLLFGRFAIWMDRVTNGYFAKTADPCASLRMTRGGPLLFGRFAIWMDRVPNGYFAERSAYPTLRKNAKDGAPIDWWQGKRSQYPYISSSTKARATSGGMR